MRLASFKPREDGVGYLTRRNGVTAGVYMTLKHFKSEEEAVATRDVLEGLTGGFLGAGKIETELRFDIFGGSN